MSALEWMCAHSFVLGAALGVAVCGLGVLLDVYLWRRSPEQELAACLRRCVRQSPERGILIAIGYDHAVRDISPEPVEVSFDVIATAIERRSFCRREVPDPPPLHKKALH